MSPPPHPLPSMQGQMRSKLKKLTWHWKGIWQEIHTQKIVIMSHFFKILSFLWRVHGELQNTLCMGVFPPTRSSSGWACKRMWYALDSIMAQIAPYAIFTFFWATEVLQEMFVKTLMCLNIQSSLCLDPISRA